MTLGATRVEASWLDWAVSSEPARDEPVAADRHVVDVGEQDALVAVADGLGHGPEAIVAAEMAISVLGGTSSQPPDAALRRCHEALRSTRGVVMSIGLFERPTGTLTWVGVGNVEGVLLRADQTVTPSREWLFLPGGVVGHNLPKLRPTSHRVSPGDTLIFATDGVRLSLDGRIAADDPPQGIADLLMASGRREEDDALVLVVRYGGRAA